MYGYRARIGYTSPPFLTETFPCEFYRMVPDGVTLVLTTLAIRRLDADETARSVAMTLEAAREMGRAGVDAIVFGGVPLNLSMGEDGLARAMRGVEAETGIPVTSSLTAQLAALGAVGARRIALLHPFAEGGLDVSYLARRGFELAGARGAGKTVAELATVPEAEIRDRARDLLRAVPDADTLYIPAPHWAVAEAIEPLERALGIPAIAAIQAIVWQALRLAGVNDRIEGYGRLLREH